MALTALLSGCSLFMPTDSCARGRLRYPGCAPATTDTHRKFKLEDTYWKLVQLEGTAVREVQLLRSAHFQLDSVRQQASGSGGCNQFTGRYALSGSDGIRFSEIANTRMSCSPGMALEQGFLDSLQRTVRWHLEGDRLQLLDAGGTTLAAFWAEDKP